jgi:hypothetical protein
MVYDLFRHWRRDGHLAADPVGLQAQADAEGLIT